MKAIFVLLAALLLAQPLCALEVDREVLPKITLGGRFIGTIEQGNSQDPFGEEAHWEKINIAESNLSLTLEKRSYQSFKAGALLRFTLTEEHELEPEEAFGFLYNHDIRLSLGLAPLSLGLLEPTTLRESDLLEYAFLSNAASEEESDQLNAELVRLDWFPFQGNLALSAWKSKRQGRDDLGALVESDQTNASTLALLYQSPEALHFVDPIRSAGLIMDRQNFGANSRQAMLAGISGNLGSNPENNLSYGLQWIQTGGLGDQDATTRLNQLASTSLLASLSYTHRPLLLTRGMISLNYGKKEWDKGPGWGQSTLALTATYRIGQLTDLSLQYSQTSYEEGLALERGIGKESSLQLGLIFYFDSVTNDQLGQRNSILNLEHGALD